MTVTALIPETKGRYRVCLQGEADLVLYGKELKQFGIAEGTDLSPEQYRRILEEVLIPRAQKESDAHSGEDGSDDGSASGETAEIPISGTGSGGCHGLCGVLPLHR